MRPEAATPLCCLITVQPPPLSCRSSSLMFDQSTHRHQVDGYMLIQTRPSIMVCPLCC
jgi:hypothetical protein